MRRWKCISVNKGNIRNFTVGKIYETDDNMLNYIMDNGNKIKCIPIIEDGDVELGLIFKELIEEEGKVKLEKEEEKKEMVSKFKVGDKVRVLDGSNIEDYTGGWCMPKSVGKIATINGFVKDNGYLLDGIDDDDSCCTFDGRGLELVSPSKTITITTSDTITTLTDGTHTTSINRYYTDKHDDMIALEEVVKKYKSEMEEIERAEKTPKVGDMVKVVDNDRTYSTYYKWFFENKITDECVMNWQYNRYPNNSSRAFRVVAIGKHNRDNVMIALIADDVYTYLINIEGLEVIK